MPDQLSDTAIKLSIVTGRSIDYCRDILQSVLNAYQTTPLLTKENDMKPQYLSTLSDDILINIWFSNDLVFHTSRMHNMLIDTVLDRDLKSRLIELGAQPKDFEKKEENE